jgi:hypothetical protein
MLDAYALGAVDGEDAYKLEGHVADCLECWAELNKSRRTASLLALSVPIRRAPDKLRRRIMNEAQAGDAAEDRPSLLQRLWHPNRRPALAGLGMAAMLVLVFGSALQVQMSDLRGDRNQLAQELDVASTEIDQQRQILAVLSAPDSERVPMDQASLRSSAESVYSWSRQSDAAFILCDGFPALPPGQVYQVWFAFRNGAESVATFVPKADGGCQIPMDLSRVNSRPEGIGISIEPEGGSIEPTRSWFAYAAFEESSHGGGGGVDFAVGALGY